MAESRGSLIAKSVQKHAGRAKEKLLQNLGKVDRTADEIFDEHLENFTKQQNAANRLQKEFSNYIRCIRAAQVASKSLLEAIGETYESQWTAHDMLYVQTQSIDMLWQDFAHKLADRVLLPLNTYQGQFPEMRKKIDKRGRKLIDYDNQRHNFQALQTNMKKRDEVKITKAREQLEEAKRTYEMLNSELHDELPALYDSRVLFVVNNLQSLFNAEHTFHSECAKAYGELEVIVDKLETDSQRGSYSLKKTNGASLPRPTSLIKNSTELIVNNSTSARVEDQPASAQTPTKKDTPTKTMTTEQLTNDRQPETTPNNLSPTKTDDKQKTATTPCNNDTKELNGTTTPDGKTSPALQTVGDKAGDKSDSDSPNVQELYDIPVGATTENLPPGVLYRVKATYKYTREDVDELSFEVGEIINVVTYDDPEEQEEGWLMGIKEGSGEKGMFPANFTRPL